MYNAISDKKNTSNFLKNRTSLSKIRTFATVMLYFVCVFFGGGMGSLCRYAIARILQNNTSSFPLATLLANILACLVLGYCMGWLFKNDWAPTYRLFWMTGFCGGFSTFSTFTAETFVLLQSGQYLYAFANIFLSLLICTLFLFWGIKLA